MDNDFEKTIYLVRHGQSTDNTLPVFQTRSSTLTTVGRSQCKEVASSLIQSGIKIDLTLSSTLPRAIESAEIINATVGGKLHFLENLSERRAPSSIEGKPYANKKASKLWHQWEENFYKNVPTEDAETSREIIERAFYLLDSVQKNQPKSVLVITHGYFLRVIIAAVLAGRGLDGALLKMIQSNIMTDNAGVTILKYNKDFKGNFSWRMVTYNNKLSSTAR